MLGRFGLRQVGLGRARKDWVGLGRTGSGSLRGSGLQRVSSDGFESVRNRIDIGIRIKIAIGLG